MADKMVHCLRFPSADFAKPDRKMVWKSETWFLVCVACTVFRTIPAAECPAAPADMCFNADTCSKLDTVKPILNNFTVEFFKKQLAGVSQSENLISSPMNWAVPLGKKCRGTSGKARSEIMAAFGINGKTTTCLDILDVILFLYRTTPHKSETPDNTDDVTVSENIVFMDKSLKVKEGYQCLWRQMFNSTYVPLDIHKNTEKARIEINSIVADKTKYFKNVLPTKGLASTTRFLALNLFYLQFTWRNPFDAALTVKGPFQNLDGSTSQADMMQFKDKSVKYGKNLQGGPVPNLPDFEVLVLPNKWLTYSLVIIVPKAAKDLPSLEKALTSDILQQLLDKISNAQMTLILPKLSLDHLSDGVAASAKVGIVTAFQKHADYTSMLDAGGTILPEQMLQKLTLEVNEKGLKATSGATTVRSRHRSMISSGPKVKVRVDRPFLFAIRMDQSGYFTYIGRVAKL